MVRSRIPGGHLTARQYLAHDALADRYGNGTLRVTTRQGLQLHGVLKGDLKASLAAINRALITTLSACGDVVRNVMWSPSPERRPLYDAIQDVAGRLAEATLPTTRAYHEVWIDGEKAYNGKAVVDALADDVPAEDDPLYGPRYLPRKFKIGVAYPGDNSVDVYTQDVGLIAVGDGEELLGLQPPRRRRARDDAQEAEYFPQACRPARVPDAGRGRARRPPRHRHPARRGGPGRPPPRPDEVPHPRLGPRPLPQRAREAPRLRPPAARRDAAARAQPLPRLARAGRRTSLARPLGRERADRGHGRRPPEDGAPPHRRGVRAGRPPHPQPRRPPHGRPGRRPGGRRRGLGRARRGAARERSRRRARMRWRARRCRPAAWRSPSRSG